jgi:ABC-type branched-subunit amino acid transport system permease subunit
VTGTLILGLLTGLTYALLAVGLVLVYKTSGFLNLAHAQLGVLGALLLAKLTLDYGWSHWLAFPIAVGSGVVVGVLAEMLLVRRVRTRRRLSLLLLSLGLGQILLALTYVQALLPDRGRLARVGYPVPFDVRWHVGGFVLRGQHVLILVLAPVLGAGLAAFLAWTPAGKAMRAVASDPDEARLCGFSPERVRATVWGIAGGLSAVTAVLQAPSQGSFNLPALGPGLLLRAVGAAAIGGFVSLPVAAAGGVALGLVEHVVLHLSGDGGVAELAVLATVVAALLIRSRAVDVLGDDHDEDSHEVSAPAITPRLARRSFVRHQRAYLGVIGLAFGVLAPLLPFFRTDSKRFLLALIVVFALLAVSLTVLMGWAGQVSLGHFALLGLGAYLTAKLEPHGASLPVILALAGGVGAVVMVVVGLPAIRLPGVVLAVTTLGFALVAPEWLYVQRWFGATGTVTARPPGLAGIGRPTSELGVYYVALAVLALATCGLGLLRRATPGRLVVAVRDNERDVATLGFNPVRIKLALLAVSGFIAAAAGVLWISAWHTISPELLSPESSFVVLAAPVVGGLGSLSGAIAGTIFVYAPGFFFESATHAVFGRTIGMTLLISGVGLVAVQLWFPGGLAHGGRRVWDRVLGRLNGD